jgi:hypothetical protein
MAIVNDTYYHDDTPNEVIVLLEDSRINKRRLLITYGDKQGNVWKDATPNRGHVGRSTGYNKLPLLIRTRRSLGGAAILDNCIVCIQESVGGRILYQHPSHTK